MKLSRLYIGLALAATAALASCQADMDVPDFKEPVASLTPNTTIAELKTAFWKAADNYAEICPDKDAQGTHYVISGRVVSADWSGNIYKSMVIQDKTAAITLSIDRPGMSVNYRIGQEVVLDVTGLYIGKYAGLEQIGGYGEYNGTPQVSFMNYLSFRRNSQLNGWPDSEVVTVDYPDPVPADKAYCLSIRLGDLPTSGDKVREFQSQLVEIRDVEFQGAGEENFAPYHETVNRTAYNDEGSIVVRNSGYSNFWARTLPEGKGTVRGILSYHSNGGWQLLLRDIDDVMFDWKGLKDDPYTVGELLSMPSYAGKAGWVQGYIVGSVKAGVRDLTSDDDILWSGAAETDNNVVIAESPEVRDYKRVVVVGLPSGSTLRKKVNLVDNSDMYGRLLAVRGQFEPTLGVPGVTYAAGEAPKFTVDGETIGDVPKGEAVVLYKGLTANADDWTFDNVRLPEGSTYVWKWTTQNGKSYLNGSAYVAGSNKEAESYAVSPEFDLTGYIGGYFSFDSAAKFQTTLQQLCGVAIREVGSQQWEALPMGRWPSAGNWTFVNTGDINISDYAGKRVQIGIRYGSSTAGADTWEINNFVLTGIKASK